MATLSSQHLFRIEIYLHPVQMLGATPAGTRRITPISGGRFEGSRLRGTVLPHAGADWVLLRADGSLQLDVRITLQTHDDALIFMSYRGVRHAAPDVAQRLAAGEWVDPSRYYFRSAPFFETGAAQYAWLNNIVSVGVGERLPEGPVYDVFEIL